MVVVEATSAGRSASHSVTRVGRSVCPGADGSSIHIVGRGRGCLGSLAVGERPGAARASRGSKNVDGRTSVRQSVRPLASPVPPDVVVVFLAVFAGVWRSGRDRSVPGSAKSRRSMGGGTGGEAEREEAEL